MHLIQIGDTVKFSEHALSRGLDKLRGKSFELVNLERRKGVLYAKLAYGNREVKGLYLFSALENASVMEWAFNLCVVLLLWGCRKTGLTYKAINVWVFCVIWPILTLLMATYIVYLKMR